MEPLGIQRLRIIGCLGGDSRRSGAYFDLPEDGDLVRAFRDYVVSSNERFGHIEDPVQASLLAAGRLLIGEIEAAGAVLDLLPERPYQRDHGAGKCLVAAPQAVASVLPLPPSLAERPERWVARSPDVAAVRSWLAEHRDRLRWRDVVGDYALEPKPA